MENKKIYFIFHQHTGSVNGINSFRGSDTNWSLLTVDNNSNDHRLRLAISTYTHGNKIKLDIAPWYISTVMVKF